MHPFINELLAERLGRGQINETTLPERTEHTADGSIVLYGVGDLNFDDEKCKYGRCFTDDPGYYDSRDQATGYKAKDARRYLLSPDARIWDPVTELDLDVWGWSDIRGLLSDFEKYDIEDESDFDMDEGWGSTSTDGLAVVGKRLGYDGTVIKGSAGFSRDGKYDTANEYIIYNPAVIKPYGVTQQVNETKNNDMTDNAKRMKDEIAAARQNVNREPTEGQKHAGNYKMGHLTINGYDISLENPKGSYRRGTDPDGKKWSCRMYHDYGYFRSTKGKDGDAIDVFIGDDYDSKKIFVIDQIIKGKFDESKVMFCFKSEKDAMEGYLANYEKGWSAGKHITEVSDDIFREWLYDGYKQRKPFYQYVQIKQNKLNEMMNIARAVLQESRKPKAYVNMGVELRKGGRNAVKMSVEDFRKEAIAAYKQYIMHCGSSNGMGSPNIDCFSYCCTCGMGLQSYGPLKDLYKDVWEGKYEFDNENHEVSGDVKMSSKGVPYLELWAGGDWESPVCYFVYFDGSKFRGYVPLKGNAICRDTNAAFGNDDEAETKFLRKEFNVKDGEESPVDYDYVKYNAKACLEDFMSRLDVKGSYKPRDLSKIDEEYDEFIKQEKAKKEALDESWAPGIPKVCPKCGSKVGLYISGEPVYLCSNKDCREYFGTMPFPGHNGKKNVNEEVDAEHIHILDQIRRTGAPMSLVNGYLQLHYNNDEVKSRSLKVGSAFADPARWCELNNDIVDYVANGMRERGLLEVKECPGRVITVSEAQIRELVKPRDERYTLIGKLGSMSMEQQIQVIRGLYGTIDDPARIANDFYEKLNAGVSGDYERSFTPDEFAKIREILRG